MCLFTEIVDDVSDTNIFARALGDRQLLVYEMSYAAKSELAMVLPIPVALGTPEDGVRFIDLEDCPRFFAELRDGFPSRTTFDAGVDMLCLGDVDVAPRTLEVHDVGAFEASFVPAVADFGRLDERFRLPVDIWLELNTYRDYGFAVFKLKAAKLHREHPMAFEFPTRHRDRIFFPTMHLHDRKLKRTARFDHTLYCQPSHAMQWHMKGWEDSPKPASQFIKCPNAGRLFDLELSAWRLRLRGELENADTWIGAGAHAPRGALEIVA
jgi:hypothetical protein